MQTKKNAQVNAQYNAKGLFTRSDSVTVNVIFMSRNFDVFDENRNG